MAQQRNKLLLISLVFVSNTVINIFGDDDPLIIQLPSGKIRGKESTTINNKRFYSFLQIPYAAPPVGKLRFKPPKEVERWPDVLDATRGTKVCYQVNRELPIETEDCLHLNVFTPKLPSQASQNEEGLPVLVYIHGGGFIQGVCLQPICGPEFLIEYDIVVVTLHYRLGPFGFLSTGDTVIPGNNGLKDQQMAIKWVNSNIHLFGGDPAKVILEGSSAGAASIAYHLLNKQSDGLFRGAILESGSCLSPWSFQRNPRDFAYKTAGFIDERFNNSTNHNSEDLLEFLQGVDAKVVDDASFKVLNLENPENRQMAHGYFYAPVLEPEHDEAFISKSMFEELQKGNFYKVPLLMGVTSEEAIFEAEDLEQLKQYMTSYDEHLEWLVPDDLNLQSDWQRNFVGHIIRKLYTNGTLEDNLDRGIKYYSDTSFNKPITKHAEIHSKFANVFFYRFSYDGEIGNTDIHLEGTDSVNHVENYNYLWRITFDGFDNTDITKFPASDITAHMRMLEIWTNFVKTLNPTPVKSDLLQNIEWPAVTEGNLQYVDIGNQLQIKSDLNGDILRAWDMIYKIWGQCPASTY